MTQRRENSPGPSLQLLVCETVLCQNLGLSVRHRTQILYIHKNMFEATWLSHLAFLTALSFTKKCCWVLHLSPSIPWIIRTSPLPGPWWNLGRRVWVRLALGFLARKELWPGRAMPSRMGLEIGQQNCVIMIVKSQKVNKKVRQQLIYLGKKTFKSSKSLKFPNPS